MKYCLSSRQSPEFLNKADEIKVQFRDRRSVEDILLKYPNKTVIVEGPLFAEDGELDWGEIRKWNILSRNTLILCLSNFLDMKKASDLGIKYYYGFPVKTFYDLQILANLGVCYVKLAAPLFFQMKIVKEVYGIPVRVVPNVAYGDGFPRVEGVLGTWIRPEDLETTYGEYVAAVEFEDCNREKEQTLYHVYAENKEWRQRLAMLITNLNVEGVGRMILPKVAESRLNCGQRCLAGGACRICYRAFSLANPDKLRDYMETAE